MNVKKVLSDKINNHTQKKIIEENFINTLEDRKEDCVNYQKEILETMTCPICNNNKFWNNLHIINQGHGCSFHRIKYLETDYSQKTGNAESYDYPHKGKHRISLKYKVCQSCGYIMQFVDMQSIGNATFDYENKGKEIFGED